MGKERLFTKDFTLDTVLSLFCSLNYFTLLINMTDYATVSFGATSAEAGLAAGLYVIGGLASRLFLGKYIELVGRRRMLLVSLAFALVMSATYFAVSSLMMLFAVRLLHGLAYGLTSSCTGDIASKLIPASRRGEGLGYFYLSITVASAIGPLLGLTLSDTGNYDLVFSVGLVMYTLALVCALFLRVPEETLTEDQKMDARSFSVHNMVQVSAVPLAATCMVFYFAYSGVLSFISPYSSEIGLTEAATYYYLAVSMGTLVSRLTTGRIYDTRGPNIVMIPGYVAFMLSMLVFSQTTDAGMFLCAGFFMGYGISIVYSVCQSIVVSKSPAHRYGVTTSTFASLNDLGTGLGPSILGLVISFAGYREMYMMCVLVAMASMVMYWVTHGRKVFGKPHVPDDLNQD